MGSGLTVVGLRQSMWPLQDVTCGSVVDAETGTKLGTPFDKLARPFADEILYLFQGNVNVVRCAVHDDGSSQPTVNVKGL